MAQTFSAIPIRQNSQNVVASWWNLLQQAGANIEAVLGGGYVGQTNFALTNGQASPISITSVSFDSAAYSSAKLEVEITQSTASGELVWRGQVYLFWRPFSASWDVEMVGVGDEPGITLSMVTTGTVGQLQYTLGTLAGSSYVGKFKWAASTFNT